MTTATRKSWFVRETEDGFYAIAKNLDTGRDSGILGPWGKALPTVEAAKAYIASMWKNGTDFPGSLYLSTELQNPSPYLESHCLADLC